MWTRIFDKIYLINLPAQKEKLIRATNQLSKYGIPFTVYPAFASEKGEWGLIVTMKAIFRDALDKGYKHILLFEDDIKFVEDPNHYMFPMIEQVVLQHN